MRSLRTIAWTICSFIRLLRLMFFCVAHGKLNVLIAFGTSRRSDYYYYFRFISDILKDDDFIRLNDRSLFIKSKRDARLLAVANDETLFWNWQSQMIGCWRRRHDPLVARDTARGVWEAERGKQMSKL